MKVVRCSSTVERFEDSAQTCIKTPWPNVEIFHEQGIFLTMACSQKEFQHYNMESECRFAHCLKRPRQNGSRAFRCALAKE